MNRAALRGLGWLRLAGVAIAGVVGFWIAANVDIYSPESSNDATKPSRRDGSNASKAGAGEHRQSGNPAAVAPKPNFGTPEEPPANLRMSPSVTQNPFGPLNLSADVELQAQSNGAIAPAAQTTQIPVGDSSGKFIGRSASAKAPMRSDSTQPARPPISVTVTPPAPAAQPSVVVAPLAPALPYAAVGSINGARVTDGQPVAFLRHGAEILVVRAGDTLASGYHVESVTAERIEFTHVPSQQRQSLSLRP